MLSRMVLRCLALVIAAAAQADEREEALQKAAASVASVTAAAQADPTRPVYHVAPEAYWTNDPNGPYFQDGVYHLFSQHNPYGKNWGHMHWAHYTSADLVHWQHQPIALWPSLSQGEEHVFSGCAIVGADGLPRIFYTSIGPKTPANTGAAQWMAVGDKAGMVWRKHEKNPVMSLSLHGDLAVREWRDPYIWKEGTEYRCVIGGELEGGKGAAFIYTSPDLENWTYRGILCEEPEPGRKGSWECPNFFRIGGKWVLIISRDGVRYFTGSFDETTWKFTPEKSGVADLERRFYAPNGLFDPQGRHVLWGWVTGVHGEQWNGCLTLPRVLSLGGDGALRSAPLPELSALRGSAVAIADHALAPSCELEIDLPAAKRGAAGVRVSNGVSGQTFAVDWDAQQLLLGEQKYPLGAEGPQRLRVFIDRSVIEVFMQDGRALTAAWPGNGAAPLTVTPFSEKKAAAPSVTAWELGKIWR